MSTASIQQHFFRSCPNKKPVLLPTYHTGDLCFVNTLIHGSVGAGEPPEAGVSGCVGKPSGEASLGDQRSVGAHRPAAHTEHAGGRTRQHR